jgi:hypothetical protein
MRDRKIDFRHDILGGFVQQEKFAFVRKEWRTPEGNNRMQDKKADEHHNSVAKRWCRGVVDEKVRGWSGWLRKRDLFVAIARFPIVPHPKIKTMTIGLKLFMRGAGTALVIYPVLS